MEWVPSMNVCPTRHMASPNDVEKSRLWTRVAIGQFFFLDISMAKYASPRSTQPPVAPAASPLQYVRRRNANSLRERGHIELIETILAIITVEK